VLEVYLHIPLAFSVRKLRGFLTVATAGVILVLADLVQRVIIQPLTWVGSARKERVLAGWLRWIAGSLIRVMGVVGGSKFEPFPRIPSAPGVLVLMNHQSLLDILNGVDTVHCRVNVSGPFSTPSDRHEISSWLEEMEGRMRLSFAALRRGAAFSRRGVDMSKAEVIRLTERRIGTRRRSDGNERVG
jgi:hypothetical protein